MFHIASSDDRQSPSKSPAIVDQSRVKLEIEDSLEDKYGPFLKKHKHKHKPFPVDDHDHDHDQFTGGKNLFLAHPSQYNPLDEPSPLGLSLRKSPSLLELIQMRLSQGTASTLATASTVHPSTQDKGFTKNNAATLSTASRVDPSTQDKGFTKNNAATLATASRVDPSTQDKGFTKNNAAAAAAAAAASDKLKASNFPASLLRIGSWEYSSKYEGDLVAKCYFAKHKLVWEVLNGGLKSKIELQWSDIMGLKADFPDDAPATLIVVLARQPLFFRETNPQPRKHTLWQATTDFTDGQASLNRKHFLQIPTGLLNKHFEKLVQCDVRLNFLSRQKEITLDSPYFESELSVFNGTNQSNSQGFVQRESTKGTSPSIFEDIATPSVSQTSSISLKQDDSLHGSEILSCDTTSPSSVIDTHSVEPSVSSETGILRNSKSVEQLVLRGIRPSVSMTNLMKQLEASVPEEDTESLQMLQDLAQHLLGDIQYTPPCSDEKFLMSRVNSLCSLLEKDDTPVPSSEATEDGKIATISSHDSESTDLSGSETGTSAPEGGSRDVSAFKRAPSMARIDSFGDLLMQLPRIASLPKFLFDISEDGDTQAR